MDRYAVFLRGVNVGGVKVLGKDLVSLLAAGGFCEVSTLLASGNVVLDSPLGSAAAVQLRCDELLQGFYGRSIPSLVFTSGEIKQLGGPFPLALPEPAAEHHAYLTLCASAAKAARLLQLAQDECPGRELAVAGRALCWVLAKGESTTDPLGKLTARLAKSMLLTTRNHNTMAKVRQRF